MKNSPLISIITVTYNADNTLEKTIQSVINQIYKNIEFIIIDGGSTDGTIGIIKKYSANISYWVSETDKGIYDAMNKGLKYAKGDFVTFLNAGDFYCNNIVIKDLFTEYNDENVIYGDIYYDTITPEPSKYLKAMNFTLDNLLNYGTAVVCHQAIFVKKSIAPLYNISYKYKSELNWYFDIVEKENELKFLHKNIAVVFYSIGGFGYVNFKKNLFEWCKLILKRYGFSVFLKYKYPEKIAQKLKKRYSGN